MVEVVVVFIIVGVVVVVVIIRFVFRWCGFFPLQSRVDSFHSAAQFCALCVVLLWMLSTSEPCGFFPPGGSVLCVVFGAVVDTFHFRAVWILSTRRIGVVSVVSRWSGFFPLNCPSAQVSWCASPATSAQALAAAVDGPRDGRCHFVL